MKEKSNSTKYGNILLQHHDFFRSANRKIVMKIEKIKAEDSLTFSRPRGKESTEVQKSQIKGKKSENSYQELKRSRKGQAHTNTRKLNRDISTGTAVFLKKLSSDAVFVVCSQTFTLFQLRKTAVLVEISRYSFRVFVCVYPSVISSIPGKSFHFPFP